MPTLARIQYVPITAPVLTPAPPSIPALSWMPVYTNVQPPARPALRVAAVPSCFYAVGAVLADSGAPSLSWTPIYTNYIQPTQSLSAAIQSTHGYAGIQADLSPLAAVVEFLIVPSEDRTYLFDAEDRQYDFSADDRIFDFPAEDRAHHPEAH